MKKKPLQERSVPALIRKHKKVNEELMDLLLKARSIVTELENRGWHHNYNYDKRRYEWQPNEQHSYLSYNNYERKHNDRTED